MGTTNWSGIGRQILDQYLQSEKGGGGGDAGQFGVDVFVNGFEDEFPGDADDPIAGTYQGYSLEANRASESRPWGGSFGDRPKIHELNQPPAAQALGWRVIDFYPNRDYKSEFYRLAGTPAELRQMLQVIQATRFVTGARINFEAWFEQWEKGFPDFASDRVASNFALTGQTQWKRIKDPESRPRYRELTNSQQRADLGYRVIEYWRDRSNEKESIILGGITDLMLIDRIIAYEYQSAVPITSEQSITSDIIRYSGIPEITLYFKGIDKSSPGKEKIIKGRKSFRFMGYTDNPEMAQKREGLELIRQSDIDRMGARIKTIFGTTPPYKWAKGKKQVVYHDWLRGYNLNIWASTHNEGERMLTNILALRDLQADEAFIKYGEAKNPTKAYPPAKDVQVLGKILKTPERLPLVDVSFEYASIYLCTLKKTQYIA
ncbi:MAG: hypothetical protein JGK38_23915 [Microcoleus sp. PH2017_15_JOR_U_A]|uniref:hypothetical protein n=1 Tax=unclassified Microcoleus TaxID=2642155 RepID=UPI001DCA1A5D|nr:MULTISPECIES: hypothetical protein [unclassified Microcoleus]MCC3473306.1 hypothetical protein [Microcoleus sp. PH2017_13_LAR_U_A]MCC3486528.1 hypothetical protein [Microcoleus sp. PH2017_14_LAR_D_A]MCC3499604.1 hypothetical protein [Microcoleus sp. PH2017_15_JOR_U_A]MCC3600175.1 hypothetical protein [Microcoleus sp. PH2017_26_ELK_O_A]MCC3623170.1 hypothetical protein [Microcoleus sp. PH2017_36_ELK_O_B]